MAVNLLINLDEYTYQYIYRYVFDNTLRELVSQTFLAVSWEDHKRIYSMAYGLARAHRFGVRFDSSKLIENEDDDPYYPDDFEEDVEDIEDVEFEDDDPYYPDDFEEDVEDIEDVEFEDVEDEVGPVPPLVSTPDVGFEDVEDEVGPVPLYVSSM
jgi:hypothetical protein